MVRTPPAPVAPSLLTWARNSIGLSVEDAARKINVASERLTAWEAGEAAPTVAQLRGLAAAYKRPLAVFFLPEPPRDFQPLRDFRRLPETGEERWSPALRLALRRAEQQQQSSSELRALLDEEPPPRAVIHTRPDDPERYAEEARSLLQVTLDEQFRWRNKYTALGAWTAALEDTGALVLQTSGIGLDEMRGFSISDPVVPVIVLNGSDAPRGRIFTAMHEWTHLLLNEAGVCDLHDTGNRHDDDVERFCNEVAGAILMPASAFEAEPSVRLAGRAGELPDAAIAELANRYSVSQEAVVRRLVSLGATSWDFYMQKRVAYQEAYARRRAEEEGFAPYHRIRVRDLGKAYVRLVLVRMDA